jgi:hypothetical protein
LVLFIYPVTLYGGIVGISILITASLLFAFWYFYPHFAKILDYSFVDILNPFFSFLSFSGVSIFLSIILSSTFLTDATVKFIGEIIFAITIYPILLAAFTSKFVPTVRDLIKTLKESVPSISPADHDFDI